MRGLGKKAKGLPGQILVQIGSIEANPIKGRIGAEWHGLVALR